MALNEDEQRELLMLREDQRKILARGIEGL
jgi:hypothetical protein